MAVPVQRQWVVDWQRGRTRAGMLADFRGRGRMATRRFASLATTPVTDYPAPMRWLRLLPALAVITLAVWETCAVSRDADSVPDDTAWRQASEVVRAQWQTGDLIVFAPAWNDPVGRMHLGDLLPVHAAARMDAASEWRISP